MKKKLRVKIGYYAILALIIALPAKGLQAEECPPRELSRMHYLRGRSYYRRAEYSKAKTAFEEVLNLDPGHQGASWYLKNIKKRLGEHEEPTPVRPRLKKASGSVDSIEAQKLSPRQKARAKKAKFKKDEEFLRNKFAQRVAELNEKLKSYEANVQEYEDKVGKLEQTTRRQVERAEIEKLKLEAELAMLRQAQRVQSKDQLREYGKTLQDKFARKELELNEKIAACEAELIRLEKENQRLKRKLANAFDFQEYEDKVRKLEQTTRRQVEKAELEKLKLEAELAMLRQAQQVQSKDQLREYKKTLQDKFARKELALNEKLAGYETKLTRLEKEKQKLAKKVTNAFEERTRLEQIEEEKQELEDEFGRLRKEQQAQLKDELREYGKTFQDKFAHKEAELDEKSRLFEPAAEPFSQRIEHAETRLFELQLKLNEQLHAQLDGLKKEKARPFYEQGLTHLKNKKYQLARESFDKALSVYPDYAEVKGVFKDSETQEKVNLHLAEGRFNYKEKDYKRAGEEFKQVLKLDYKNETARNYLRKIEKELKKERRAQILVEQKEKECLKKESARLEKRKHQAQQEAIMRAWKKTEKEQARKVREEELARLKAEKEQKFVRTKTKKEQRLARLKAGKEERAELKREAEAKRRKQIQLKKKQARLKKEQEQKAGEEKLTRRRTEKEQKLARLKAGKEERAELKREAEAKRRKQAQLKKEQTRLKKEQARKAREEKKARLKAEKEQKPLKVKAEKEKRLRLKRRAEAKRRRQDQLKKKQARLKKEQEQKAGEEKLARIKAEKEQKLAGLKTEKEKEQKELQEKIELHYACGKEHFRNKNYIAARKEFRDILSLDPGNKYASNALEKIDATIAEEERALKQRQQQVINQQLARGKVYFHQEKYQEAIEAFGAVLSVDPDNSLAEKYLVRCKKEFAKAKRREERRLIRERQSRETALKEAQAKLAKRAKIKTREEKLACIQAEKKQRRTEIKAEKEQKLLKVKAEKEKRLRLKRRAEAKRRRQVQLKKKQARLKKEQKQKAREQKLVRLKAERGEKLARRKAGKEEQPELKREAEAKRRRQVQLKKKQPRLKKEQKQKAGEQKLARLKAERGEKLARRKAEKEKEQKELQEKIELHYSCGKKHFGNKDYISARKEFKNVLSLDAGNKYALNALEKIDTTIAEEEKALKHRQQVINQQLARGKVYFHQEKYQEAIEAFGEVLSVDSGNSLAERYLIRCKKEFAKAKRREEAQLRKEQTRLEREQKRKAEEEKLACLKAEQEQRLAKLKGEKEEKLAKLQQQKKATCLEKTARVIKEEKEAETLKKIKRFYNKGKSCLRRGLYAQAIACFEEVIELEGNPCLQYTPQAKEFIERAKSARERKRKEGAWSIAEEEVERRKAKEAQKLKAQERAQEEAARKEEETIRKYYKAGKNYYRRGNYPMAIAELNKIKEIDARHPYVSYAEKYIRKSREKIIQREEVDLRAEMKSQAPDFLKEEFSSENLLIQARWYYKRGNYEQAIKICRAALELEPLNKELRNLLHQAELKQVKKEKKQADREIGVDEKEMLAEVAKTQVLPEEKSISVKEKKFTPIVKVPAMREKLKAPITVDFRDVDLSYVLNFLADSCGVNVIAASGVSLEGKKVTIRMKDVPAENALKYILRNQGLTYRLEEDVVWVASPAEMDNEEVEPRVYFLNRGLGMFTEFERAVGTGTGLGGAASISKITTIKDTLGEAVNWPKDSKLVLDERTGALIISNTPSNLKIIEDILYNLDMTPVQVLVEARFVELEVTDVEELGIEWKVTEDWGVDRSAGSNVGQLEENAGWDFTSFSRAAEGLNLTYTGVLTYPQFQVVVHALSESKNAKTLSSPRITTLNNQRASIKVVDEWIYPTRYEFQVVQSDVNGDGDFDDANETTYKNVPVDFITKDVGIILHVTPNIGADGRTITLALVPEVSEGTADYFSYSGSISLPKFTSRTLSTSVVINNGETVALGGLIKETTTKTVTKVPLLGDIPVLGHLFRKKSDSIVRKNLLIFVTATIISPSGERIETVQQQ